MTKKIWAVPGVVLSIVFLGATLAPSAVAQSRTLAATQTVAQPTALVMQADPTALFDDLQTAITDALSTGAGIVAALVSGFAAGVNTFGQNLTSDDAAAAQSQTAVTGSASAAVAAAQAGVTNAQNTGEDVANVILDFFGLVTPA